MLSWILPEFESLPADIDENPLIGELPVPYCQRMALGKALHFADSLPEGGFVLGSDTTVYINHQILGKPEDEEQAEEMLKMLNGKEHLVCTAVTLACRKNGETRYKQSISETVVRDEIRDYVKSGDPMGKAGAYAIQNRIYHPVEAISGCYAAVMGLPLCHLGVLFHHFGVEVFPQIRSACFSGTKYPCSTIPAVNVTVP